MRKNLRRVCVVLPLELHDWAKAVADQNGLSVSQIIRWAVQHFKEAK